MTFKDSALIELGVLHGRMEDALAGRNTQSATQMVEDFARHVRRIRTIVQAIREEKK